MMVLLFIIRSICFKPPLTWFLFLESFSLFVESSYRDVKPDNILLDEKGNAHLTDFNIAVHFSERRALTSIAGSMAYMAPEVLLKKGYTYTVDWWSLGVTGWELLFGKRPFRGKTNSALTNCILKDSLRLPENKPQEVSEECMSFLRGVSRTFLLPACTLHPLSATTHRLDVTGSEGHSMTIRTDIALLSIFTPVRTTAP